MSEPKLLTDKNLQKLILDNPKKAELSLSCVRLSALHRFGVAFPAKGQSPFRPNESSLAKSVFQKTYAKTAIGVEFTMRKVLQVPLSGSPKAIRKAAESILGLIKRKGNGKS